MDKEQVTKILEKIKKIVGENNYKLALAITGHRPGKIRDVTMASKDGELLLEYIDNLEHQVKKQKEIIDKVIEYIKEKQKIQYKFALSHIECDDLLQILEDKEASE